MSSDRKGSSPKFRINAQGHVQHLAKQIQKDFKLTYSAAVAEARKQLRASVMDVSIAMVPTALSAAFTSEVILNGATAASYAWNFGDGNTDTTEDAVNVYAAAGTYHATLVVTDTLGNSSMAHLNVAVSA